MVVDFDVVRRRRRRRSHVVKIGKTKVSARKYTVRLTFVFLLTSCELQVQALMSTHGE